jgi:GTP 3',8-cyclase
MWLIKYLMNFCYNVTIMQDITLLKIRFPYLKNIFIANPISIYRNHYKSLRVKVTGRCPFTCNFCHHEGSPESDDLIINELVKTVLLKFIKEYKITEIHLTGGEPSSYGELSNIIQLITNLNLEVKMTSNGQFDTDTNLLDKLKKSGLKSINISVNTLDPVKLSQIMKPQRDEDWGKKALNRQLTNLIYAKQIGIKSKINTIAHNNSDISSIIDFCKTKQVELRILDDLFNPISVQEIFKTLESLNATVTGINLNDQSSAFSYNIELPDGFKFKVKAIDKTFLNSLCNNCEIRPSCKEGFYGIRLEQVKESLMIRLCLHRQDYPAKQTIQKFFRSDQFFELINF